MEVTTEDFRNALRGRIYSTRGRWISCDDPMRLKHEMQIGGCEAPPAASGVDATVPRRIPLSEKSGKTEAGPRMSTVQTRASVDRIFQVPAVRHNTRRLVRPVRR